MRQGWSLDDTENHAGESGAAAPRSRVLQGRDNRGPMRAVLYEDGRCWCGDPLNHGWPGKDSGSPHPRVLPEGLRRFPAPWQAAGGVPGEPADACAPARDAEADRGGAGVPLARADSAA